MYPTRYRTAFIDVAEEASFDRWVADGALVRGGQVALDAREGTLPGHREKGAGAAQGVPRPDPTGAIESPPIAAPWPFVELVPSWNGRAPARSWLRVSISAGITEGDGVRWTRWYGFGIWSEGAGPDGLGRRSEAAQEDDDGAVATDILRLKVPASAFRVRIELGDAGVDEGPSLDFCGVALSSDPSAPRPDLDGDRRCWNSVIAAVPRRSQMVFPDGGSVWCSPTALSMVLGYWRREEDDRPDRVRETATGVWDAAYGGHGNWAFNVAYAGSLGFRAAILRFDVLARLEPLVAAGFPLILSLSWDQDGGRPLDGAPLPSSRGHLTVLVGFDAEGNPVVNEPASPDEAGVRRTYRRDQFERRWQEASSGTTYLVHPPERRLPDITFG